MVQQECRKIDRNVFLTKTETDDEFAKPSPMCTTTYAPHHSGKLRQNLTEVPKESNCFFCNVMIIIFKWSFVIQAEKEARRLRRVLANRESARQTIRRRQVNYICWVIFIYWRIRVWLLLVNICLCFDIIVFEIICQIYDFLLY